MYTYCTYKLQHTVNSPIHVLIHTHRYYIIFLQPVTVIFQGVYMHGAGYDVYMRVHQTRFYFVSIYTAVLVLYVRAQGEQCFVL